MENNNMRVVDLKVFAKEHGLRGYSKLRKAELITLFQNNIQQTPALHTRPAPRTRPSRPTRPPPPPPTSVRPRQPELLRQLEERPVRLTTFKPYQLKPKRGQETFIEPSVKPVEVPPPSSQKQIKRMKKS